VPTLSGQVVQQPTVGRVASAAGHQLVDLRLEASSFRGQGGRIQRAGVVGVPQPQRMLQDPAHRVRGLGLPPVGVSDQFPAASQQVRQAGLVGRMDQAAIRRPAVPLDRLGVVGAQHRHGVEVATPTGDAVDGDALADEGPQPRLGAADPPAGLIRATTGLARTPWARAW
jgi:hypothetical protein